MQNNGYAIIPLMKNHIITWLRQFRKDAYERGKTTQELPVVQNPGQVTIFHFSYFKHLL